MKLIVMGIRLFCSWFLPGVGASKAFELNGRKLPLPGNIIIKHNGDRFFQYSPLSCFFLMLVFQYGNAAEPVPIIITCPPDVTVGCGNITPSATGNPTVIDPCDPTPTIEYYDYTLTPPAAGSEMRWVLMSGNTTSGSCSSATNCQSGTICIGLQYTPGVTGTLTSYTTGFFVNCFNGNNPILYNASCVMIDNSETFEDCAGSGILLMNSSGNAGTLAVKKHVPVILHQVCLQLGSGGSILFDEDEGTDLTTSVELQGGGLFSELPDYTNYSQDYDDYCSGVCQDPYTIYRKFVVTDDCNNLATCVQHIDLQDTTPPNITCPPNVTLSSGANTLPAATGVAVSTDPCDNFPLVTSTDVITPIGCPPNFLITRTWKSTDDCGNTNTCVQTISVFVPLIVSNTNDTGNGSLRYNIDCANPGDTIRFHPSLSGQTIWLTSQYIDLIKNLVFISNLAPRVTIGSSTIGLFSVLSNVSVEFRDLNLVSGNVIGQEGAAFDNLGQIKLHNVNVTKNPAFPLVERLIRNQINSSLFLTGTCTLDN